jgi:hypothetical protein
MSPKKETGPGSFNTDSSIYKRGLWPNSLNIISLSIKNISLSLLGLFPDSTFLTTSAKNLATITMALAEANRKFFE